MPSSTYTRSPSPMPTRKGDRLRGGGASITVPAALARMIGPDRLFRVGLADEGLLYRYVDGGEPVMTLPWWLVGRDG